MKTGFRQPTMYTKNVWRYQMGSEKRKSKKYRQYNDQKKKNERANNNLQNTTQKTKDRTIRTPLKSLRTIHI